MSILPVTAWCGGAPETRTTWTVMVYMADDTSTPLPWEENLNAMEAAAQASGTNVVALVDRADYGDATLLKVQPDTNISQERIVSTVIDDGHQVIPVTGEVNTGSSETLSAFIEFCATAFPADRYVLVLWGHGSAWHGLCPDGTDFLSLPELRRALGEATTVLGRPLDLVVADACTQATAEMLFELQGYAEYFVAAETNVPYQGFPYTSIFNALAADPDQSVERFGKTIADECIRWAMVTAPYYSATIAVFDMYRFVCVSELLGQLSAEGMKYEALFHSVLGSSLMSAEQYEIEWYMDFGDAMSGLTAAELPYGIRYLALEAALAARDMTVAVEKYISPSPADGVWANRSAGLAVYVPSDSPADSEYSSLRIADTLWDELGRAIRTPKADAEPLAPPSSTLADHDGDGRDDTLIIRWGESYDALSAWLFRQEPGGLVFLGRADGHGDSMYLSSPRWFGSLLVAAGGEMSGQMRSYALLSVTLPGSVALSVVLGPENQLDRATYDVMVTTKSRELFLEDIGHSFTILLQVPEDGNIGEQFTVVVLVNGSEEVIGSWNLSIPSEDGTASVLVASFRPPHEPSMAVMVLFSALPGALLLAFAIALQRDRRRAG